MIRFSVVIATRNRATMAVRAARSALEQRYPVAEFEVVVVDNGSSDGTVAALEALKADCIGSSFSVIVEDEPGAGRARNAGATAAAGRYIVFLDDDAVAPPGFLAAAAEFLDGLDREPGAFGGPIEPLYDCEKPAWFQDRYERRSWGAVARELGPEEVLSGSNMAWRKEVLEAIGGFDVGLGPTGARFAMGEDTELCLRLRRMLPAESIWYSPTLSVGHSVTTARLSSRAALRRAYKEGLGWVAAHPPHGAGRWLVEVLRRHAILVGVALVSLVSLQWLLRPRNWCFERGKLLLVQVGNIAGLWRRALGGRR